MKRKEWKLGWSHLCVYYKGFFTAASELATETAAHWKQLLLQANESWTGFFDSRPATWIILTLGSNHGRDCREYLFIIFETMKFILLKKFHSFVLSSSRITFAPSLPFSTINIHFLGSLLYFKKSEKWKLRQKKTWLWLSASPWQELESEQEAKASSKIMASLPVVRYRDHSMNHRPLSWLHYGHKSGLFTDNSLGYQKSS